MKNKTGKIIFKLPDELSYALQKLAELDAMDIEQVYMTAISVYMKLRSLSDDDQTTIQNMFKNKKVH